ncbi:phosphoribosylglycinamide formyltransferase [Leptospira kanakyensis]|uniref:Phosphoribosylglycinamide formyltransferase n=1 Tax=Leptospira kanakyensis TaxID=2484968 RepID=A0A6N4QBE8_9LEPT|nr:phosphoribosylglycinamide formyltransferase [Leptospira kanakyensis]MCW7470475.1 phosphoribosylglycinamide formyltransferase [Leptospira kanakyensis]MCW7481565.1 phosphoribosylglycinamide formyltransferase [Leptospira kanakyensis]TGK53897.1 phosphoribosylglycinamide formyltransferase [Leptospira kanakyensis]TGK57692.1 phosphoribosylglycinamide formyltransferase [Leptospira kanakyensis]TGK73402.1 phosphoribosylglycinamide formyltransferase [Leptospira kanakyensis]
MGKIKRVVFLASGRGSNFTASVEYIRKKKLKSDLVALVTDNPEAKALGIAKSFGIPTKVIPYVTYPQKIDYHKDLLAEVETLDPDLIVACGYMRILKPEFVRRFRNRIINVHPSLLPAFPGLDSQKQALDYGVKVAGCTVHFVEEGVDTGPIILQKAIAIAPEWTEKELSLAILAEEHKILPLAIQLFCEDKLKIKERKVEILK